MDRIKQVYSSLSASERKGVRHYLEAFHTKGENKSIELLRLIDKNPATNHEQAATKLYGDPRSKAFIMMKGRLLDKMVEFLSLSVNPDAGQRDPIAPQHDDTIEFRRLMLFAAEMQKRQLGDRALEFLEQALAVARRINSSEFEADAMLRLRGLDRSGLARFEELSKEIKQAMVRMECEVNAGGLMRKLLAMYGNNFTPPEEIIGFLETHIGELEDAIRQVYSPRADYFLQMLRVHLFVERKDLELGQAAIQSALTLLEKHDGIRNQLRLADSWFQQGRLNLACGHYEDALHALDQAGRTGSPGNRQGFMQLIFKFVANFLLQKFSEARDCLEQMGSEPIASFVKNSTVGRGLYNYYTACLAHAHGDYQAAWVALQNSQEAALGRDTWLTGVRLFEVMVLVDKGEFDLVSQKLENLRKHNSRYNVPERLRIAYKLLAAQERHSFSFKPVTGEAEMIAQLSERLDWSPTGFELQRFDEWYIERRKRTGISTVI